MHINLLCKYGLWVGLRYFAYRVIECSREKQLSNKWFILGASLTSIISGFSFWKHLCWIKMGKFFFVCVFYTWKLCCFRYYTWKILRKTFLNFRMIAQQNYNGCHDHLAWMLILWRELRKGRVLTDFHWLQNDGYASHQIPQECSILQRSNIYLMTASWAAFPSICGIHFLMCVKWYIFVGPFTHLFYKMCYSYYMC